MINKFTENARQAVADIEDGSTIMIGGFGDAGSPVALVDALIEQGAKDLTVISNNAGNGIVGLGALVYSGRVRKVVCSFPKSADASAFADLYRQGKIELELVPQGTLAERIRAAGAGIPGFYVATAVGTPLAEGKESRLFDGREFILETALHADFALVRADRADRFGNLTYNKTARNFGPVMCMAAKTTIVEVRQAAEEIDPEHVITPGIFVGRVVVDV